MMELPVLAGDEHSAYHAAVEVDSRGTELTEATGAP
jgi:hypothetical protein